MKTTTLDDATAAALARFKNGPSTAIRGAAITELLTRRALSRVVKTADFQVGVTGLIDDLSAVEPLTRLGAAAQLGRIEQSAKSIGAKIRALALPSLGQPLPLVTLLKDADERFYVAKVCGWSEHTWVLEYAIHAVAEEAPNADAVRAEFLKVAFREIESLADIFVRLAAAVQKTRAETESPADSAARKLTKILASLRQAIATSIVPPGEDVGLKMGEFIRAPFIETGLPVEDEVRRGLTQEIVLCTYDVLRTRMSVFTDAETYSAIRFARRLFPRGGWPDELLDSLSLLTEALLEAMLLLGKQGIASRPLAEQLELVSGYRELAEKRMRALADANPSLPENVRAWLRKPSGSEHRPSEALQESQQLRADPSIGEAMIEAMHLEAAISDVAANVQPVLELYDPPKAVALREMISKARKCLAAIHEVGKRRGLRLHGSTTEAIEFVPKYFETVHAATSGMVRVIRPAVVRQTSDGALGEVVIKGLVE